MPVIMIRRVLVASKSGPAARPCLVMPGRVSEIMAWGWPLGGRCSATAWPGWQLEDVGWRQARGTAASSCLSRSHSSVGRREKHLPCLCRAHVFLWKLTFTTIRMRELSISKAKVFLSLRLFSGFQLDAC
jgi:hypothetical protein